MSSEWYVIRIQPRAEYLAAEELTRDGYEIFFPCIKSVYARVGHVDTPLFPGYMFIKFDSEIDGWPSFRSAHRVAGWLNFQGVVPTVPSEVVAGLAQRLDEKDGGQGLWRRFRPGDLVQVATGSLAGLGEVVEGAKTPTGRAKVLLEFMGRLVEAKVPWDSLQFAEENTKEQQRLPRRTRGRGRWTQGFRSRLAVKS